MDQTRGQHSWAPSEPATSVRTWEERYDCSPSWSAGQRASKPPSSWPLPPGAPSPRWYRMPTPPPSATVRAVGTPSQHRATPDSATAHYAASNGQNDSDAPRKTPWRDESTPDPLSGSFNRAPILSPQLGSGIRWGVDSNCRTPDTSARLSSLVSFRLEYGVVAGRRVSGSGQSSSSGPDRASWAMW